MKKIIGIKPKLEMDSKQVKTLENHKVYKPKNNRDINMFPSDPIGSLDDSIFLNHARAFMEETIVFIDSGFLSKLSKHLGKGEYIKFDLIKFTKNLGKKQKLFVRKAFYYTAPPFQSYPPTEEEIRRKKGYDKFVNNFRNNAFFCTREGRCQKIFNGNGKEKFNQKGVDSLMVADMVSVPIKFPNIQKIILVTSDTDFCPIISQIESLGIKVLLYTYYERKRNTKFSVSHHLIDCCQDSFYLTKQDFDEAILRDKEK